MGIFRRRRIDLTRRAVAVAAEAGWDIERWCDKSGAVEPSVDGMPVTSVSMLVSGGGLRGSALASLSLRLEEGEAEPEEFSAIMSEHVPRTLSPPGLRALRAPRGQSLVLRVVEHPVGGTLADLLTRRVWLSAGEGATVLTAVARGLADIHACGRAGVLLTTSHVGFRDDGCPILTGGGPLRPLDEARARADVKAYALLAAAVSSAVGGAEGVALLAAATADQHRRWEDVIRAVPAAADPIAVEWQPAAVPALARLPSTGSPQPEGSRDVDMMIDRDELWAAVSASKHRAGALESPRRDPPSPPAVRRNTGRRAASREISPRNPAKDDRLVLAATAPSPANELRRALPSVSAGGRDPAGSDRMLRAVERLLDGIGDRPVVRVMRVVRAWAVARPLVVVVAVVPVVAVLLALALIPHGDQGVDVVGKSSSTLLRASGTGPNGCELPAESRGACGG